MQDYPFNMKDGNHGRIHRPSAVGTNPAGLPTVPTTLLPASEHEDLDGWRYIERDQLPRPRKVMLNPVYGASHQAPGHSPALNGVKTDEVPNV